MSNRQFFCLYVKLWFSNKKHPNIGDFTVILNFFVFFSFRLKKKTQKFYFFIFFCRIFTKNVLEKVYNIPERFSKGFEPKINAPARIGKNSKFGQFFQLNASFLQMIPKLTSVQFYMSYKSYFGLVKKF